MTNAINLNSLALGMPGLSKEWGSVLAQAAAVCLEKNKHTSSVSLKVTGLNPNDYQLSWTPITDQIIRSNNDLQEATEYGACGVAILLINKITGKVVIERSKKGTGFDYWLGLDDDSPLFSNQDRLEISGILTGDEKDIKYRITQKKAQIKSKITTGESYVAVIEFGAPHACVEA